MLSVYFPFWASNVCSAFPVSTLYMEILPSFSPDITYLLQGENCTVQRSTGPKLSRCFLSPERASHKHMVESRELLAMAGRKAAPLIDVHFSISQVQNLSTYSVHRNWRPQKQLPGHVLLVCGATLGCCPPASPTPLPSHPVRRWPRNPSGGPPSYRNQRDSPRAPRPRHPDLRPQCRVPRCTPIADCRAHFPLYEGQKTSGKKGCIKGTVR